MGMLNAVAAAVWRLWAQPQARPVFEQQAPSDTAHSSTRIIYVPRTEAGVRVTQDIALQYSAVFACVRIIAETMASLTWHVFRQLPNGGKEPVPGTVQFMLRDQANPETTAFSWREQMVASALLWGGGYSEIVRDGAGRAIELWQIAPGRVNIDRVRGDGRLIYEVDNHLSGNSVLEADQVFQWQRVVDRRRRADRRAAERHGSVESARELGGDVPRTRPRVPSGDP